MPDADYSHTLRENQQLLARPGCSKCGVIRTEGGAHITAYCAECRKAANGKPPKQRRALDRFVHHWYAVTFGYFWAPCPACGDMRGGHEPEGKTVKTFAQADEPNVYTWTCDTCAPHFDHHEEIDAHPTYRRWIEAGAPQPWKVA